MPPTSRKKNKQTKVEKNKHAKDETSEPEEIVVLSDDSSSEESEVIVKKKSIPPRESLNSKSGPSRTKSSKAKNDVSSDEETKTAKTRAPRKKVTIETHLEKYDKLIEFLDEHIDHLRKNKEPGSRVFTTIRKSVRELNKEAPKIANSRRKTTLNNQNKVSGFVLQCQISPELADFLQVSHTTTLCRKDVTNAICVYSHLNPIEAREHMLRWEYLNRGGKRNLQNPKERMAIIPDSALSKLLQYNQYKKDVKGGLVTKNVRDKKTRVTSVMTITEPTLYYWVIQKLLSRHYVATLKNKPQVINIGK